MEEIFCVGNSYMPSTEVQSIFFSLFCFPKNDCVNQPSGCYSVPLTNGTIYTQGQNGYVPHPRISNSKRLQTQYKFKVLVSSHEKQLFLQSSVRSTLTLGQYASSLGLELMSVVIEWGKRALFVRVKQKMTLKWESVQFGLLNASRAVAGQSP